MEKRIAKIKSEFGGFLSKVKQNVHEIDSGAQVWLYGSRARGDAREDSDWDILVLSPRKKLSFKDEERFMDHICDLIVETGQVVQLFAYGEEDWHKHHSVTPFYQSIKSEGILL